MAGITSWSKRNAQRNGSTTPTSWAGPRSTPTRVSAMKRWPTIDPPQVSHLFIALTLVGVLLGPAQDVGVVLPFLCAFLFDHEVMPAIQSQSFVIHQASSTTTLDSMTVPPERSVRTL